MPEPIANVVTPTPDPLAGLRAGVDAHRQVVEASVRAGAELQQQPPAPTPKASDQ